MVAQKTRDYELVMILSPEATEEDISGIMERVDLLITGPGGGITEHNVWGLRRLAFPVKKFQEGNYVLTRFTMDPDQVLELNRGLVALEDVLRFLVTKV